MRKKRTILNTYMAIAHVVRGKGGGGSGKQFHEFMLQLLAVYLIVDPEPLQQVHVYEHPYAGLQGVIIIQPKVTEAEVQQVVRVSGRDNHGLSSGNHFKSLMHKNISLIYYKI